MDNEMKAFAQKWCTERNFDILNLSDEQINKLCLDWVIKCLNIPFKTIDEWRKDNE